MTGNRLLFAAIGLGIGLLAAILLYVWLGSYWWFALAGLGLVIGASVDTSSRGTTRRGSI